MAVAPQLARFEMLDLRSFRARDLDALLEEEQRAWLTDLYWDYRPSAQMVRKHLDSRTLMGKVARIAGQVAGFTFYVQEEEKGLVGDLYVLERYRREQPVARRGVASLLLEEVLQELERSPRVRRLEAQLIPWGTEPLAPIFLAHHFHSYPRLFMYKRLARVRRGQAGAAATDPPGFKLLPWDDLYFEPAADLVVSAYRDHVDGQINDQYSHRAGALRFLKNIVVFPGCGVFQPETSLVAVESDERQAGRLAGAVLTSQVAPGIAHVTQVSVRRELQGRGLGRRLMEASLERLAARGFSGVSLTVTAENQPAVGLYHRLGFQIIKSFAAFARTLR